MHVVPAIWKAEAGVLAWATQGEPLPCGFFAFIYLFQILKRGDTYWAERIRKRHYNPRFRKVLLKLKHAYQSPGEIVPMQIAVH